MRVLLHICCGVCATYSVEHLRDGLGHEVVGFFYNPNIHPYTEFRERLGAARAMAERYGLELVVDGEYDLEGFLRRVVFRERQRCPLCYHMRLSRTARRAAELGFDAFTTTLLISPYQKEDTIKAIGTELAASHGLQFLSPELRAGFRAAQQRAAQLGLYRQKYCGCIYSEKERYLRKKR